jgi:Rne/Rng family ribonuclease
MAKEICISSTPHETRLAILEDDQLAEIYYERENEYTLAGSIYNGRVTRVLPGMQSAFVDIGLERDAFLYVTDFLELEDQEEADELEKAAASNGNQPPREVRHGGREEDRGQRSGRRFEPRQEQSPAAAPQEPSVEELQFETLTESDEELQPGSEVAAFSEASSTVQGDVNESGTKRWRGRRRRRRGGSREAQPLAQSEAEESTDYANEVILEGGSEIAPEIQANSETPIPGAVEEFEEEVAAPAQATPRAERAPVAGTSRFVLPGESLSKYGRVSAEEPVAPAAPARPASTYKPSTLIEVPIVWDGSGVLPGESLSKHKSRQVDATAATENLAAEEKESAEAASSDEEAPAEAPAAEVVSVAPVAESQPEAVETIEEIEESVEFAPETRPKIVENVEPEEPAAAAADAAERPGEEEFVEEELVKNDATQENQPEVAPAAENEAATTDEPKSEADASYNVDPLPPSGFRLFGLGGKKKKDEEPEKNSGESKSVPAAAHRGVAEEDFIEEEHIKAPRQSRRARGKEAGQEIFEEQTRPAKAQPGVLGDLLEEAQINHHIDVEEEIDEEEDEGENAGQAQPRRDRDRDRGRGRRGRGGAAQQGGRRGNLTRRSAQVSDLPIISDLLKPGQEILVQIAKEPIAKKGARITSHIALPGRFLVFMPTVSHIGVSRKIESDAERMRLKKILVSERGEAQGGFIVRTAAEGASEEELRADLRFLLHMWNEIKQRSDSSKSPALIYHDLSLIERILRDQVSSDFTNIWVDSEADYERIVRFLNRFSPTLVRRVKLYNKEIPLFEHFGIEDEISKALRSKVWLKSGGSIVINQTEALVAIDINTGKYVGKSARLEDTIVRTNLDAVPEIVRQIRLRDLGGIIVIDFIDMDDRKNRFKVMAALEEALKSDRAPTKVLQFNDFGLVAITRKRVKQSLERTLSVPCPTCQATGMVKSPMTVCNEIYIELRKMRKHFEGEDVMLRVHPETVKVLKSNGGKWLTEFEELAGKNILIKSDAALHPEQFDIQG